MKWFRRTVKIGSRLALFALAIQFALSFGHFHEASRSRHRAGLTQADPGHAPLAAPDTASQVAQQQQPANHDTDQPSQACAICAVSRWPTMSCSSTPPLLPLPQAAELLYLTTRAEFAHLIRPAPRSSPALLPPPDLD